MATTGVRSGTATLLMLGVTFLYVAVVLVFLLGIFLAGGWL